MLGLEDYLARKPAALSGGQRQRVAMGRAIVREPQAFLMDEPLSNLDAKLRVSMRASLSQLHARLGVTTVYVTHDQVEAMTLGQRVCVLRDGQLQQADTPQTLYNSPVNLFVAGFIGSPAMNFATAELVRDDGPAVVFAGHRLSVPRGGTGRPAGTGRVLRQGADPGRPALRLRGRQPWPSRPGHGCRSRSRVTEELGSEIHAIFFIDAPQVQHASITQARSDEGEDEAIPLADNKTQWTARVAARSGIKPGSAGAARRSTRPTCSSSTRSAACRSGTRRTRRHGTITTAVPSASAFGESGVGESILHRATALSPRAARQCRCRRRERCWGPLLHE